MAGKKHKRYKLRKRMNSIKHEPKSLFNSPPVLIRSWNDLKGLENDRYFLDIDIECGNGWIQPKFKICEDHEYLEHHQYLSTHTFYGNQYYSSTVLLRKLGFNVQLINWDGDTVYCKH